MLKNMLDEVDSLQWQTRLSNLLEAINLTMYTQFRPFADIKISYETSCQPDTMNDTTFMLEPITYTKPIPLIVAIGNPNDPVPDYITQHIVWLQEQRICKFLIINSLKDLPSALAQNPDCILLADDDVIVSKTTRSEFISMLKTLISYAKPDSEIKIGYLLEKFTPYESIKELKKLGVTALIPGMRSYPKEETTEALKAFTQGITYYPEHLIKKLKPATKTKEQTITDLTSRQQQIYNLVVERGLSNKQIAKTLNITESAVKIHLSNIYKKLGVRNRTQLAVFKDR